MLRLRNRRSIDTHFLAGSVLLLTACFGAPEVAEDRQAGGTMELEWTGSATGRFSSKASARWCPSPRRLEITAIRVDSGAAIALTTPDSIALGRFRLTAGARADTGAQGIVALRWLRANATFGFRSTEGEVTVTRNAGHAVEGTIRAELASVTDSARLSLTGRFNSVPLLPGTAECDGASAP